MQAPTSSPACQHLLHSTTFSIAVSKFHLGCQPKVALSLEQSNFKKFASSDYAKLSPTMRESFKKIVNENLERCAEKVSSPCLLVFGNEDRETPLYMARKLNGKIKGSGLVIMNGCGHFCFTENPFYFNALAEEFFN